MSWFKSGPPSPNPFAPSPRLRDKMFRRGERPLKSSSTSLPANSLTENFSIYQDAVDPRFHSLPNSTTASSNASMWSADSDEEHAQLRDRASQTSRIDLLQSSLANPQLAPDVRRVLEAALNQFRRNEQWQQELLPPYTKDLRPPYTERC